MCSFLRTSTASFGCTEQDNSRPEPSPHVAACCVSQTQQVSLRTGLLSPYPLLPTRKKIFLSNSQRIGPIVRLGHGSVVCSVSSGMLWNTGCIVVSLNLSPSLLSKFCLSNLGAAVAAVGVVVIPFPSIPLLQAHHFHCDPARFGRFRTPEREERQNATRRALVPSSACHFACALLTPSLALPSLRPSQAPRMRPGVRCANTLDANAPPLGHFSTADAALSWRLATHFGSPVSLTDLSQAHFLVCTFRILPC